MSDTRLYTIEETATVLSLSETTIKELIRSGTLPVVYPRPRAPRISAIDLDAYVASLRRDMGLLPHTDSHTTSRPQASLCARRVQRKERES